MPMTNIIRQITPPILVQLAKRLTPSSTITDGMVGPYKSWAAAAADSTGYDADDILTKTRDALFKVKSGEAAYERDTLLRDQVVYFWPMLAGVLWAAARDQGRLSVLDFGGSLGSSYFQNRAFLDQIQNVSWNIVEQAKHVALGQQQFADERLKFFPTIAECAAVAKPNVVLISGSLQFIESAHALFAQLLAIPGVETLVVDRTPFHDGESDIPCVQRVPPNIYPGSYPCWIFSLPNFRAAIPPPWKIIAEFKAMDWMRSPVDCQFRGMIIAR